MMKRYKIFTYLSILLASLAFFSCEDKFNYNDGVIGDGEALVEATLTFKADVANLGSRSSGTAISTIEDLQIVIYNADDEKSLYKLLTRKEVKFVDDVDNPTSSTPDDYPQHSETTKDEDGNETTTVKDKTTEYATHKVKVNDLVLPYGKYYIYAVANLGRDLTDEEVVTIDALKSVECTWDFAPMQYEFDRTNEDATPNGKQINAQMFGYFTSIDNPESRNTNGSAFDEEDPFVVINQPMVKLHSWIKRLASKVTIAYDGRGLHEGVYVYIHNVSIRQIPYKCYLGKNNDPQGVESVTPAYFDKSIPKEYQSQALYYNQDGSIGSWNTYNPTEANGQEWMVVAKGEASNTDHPGIIGAYNHTNTDPALFFYENMKGVHDKNPKPQQPDSVGTNVKEDDWLGDYQDGIKYGTFIEVEAYYKCDIVPVSQGPIRYRYMLGQDGKDKDYNYNAIRNCHYKLTLGFRGYANQPDWHIEYERKVPEINAPVVYIPYTYNTSVEFPITVTGNPTSIDVELIENNWGPYDLDNDKVPDGNPNPSVNKTDFDQRTLQFEWWRAIYDNDQNTSDPGYAKSLTINENATNNSRNNFLYGRHKSVQKLTPEGKLSENSEEYYSVTPIWAGFLRLVQPSKYVDDSEDNPISTEVVAGAGDASDYRSISQLNDFRNYYLDCPDSDVPQLKNLGKRTFKIWDPKNPSTENSLDVPHDELNRGRNAYTVEKELDAESKVKGVSITMNLWTQPKTMCGISGFSGNNPYEDYARKAVLRITAHYPGADGTDDIIMKDVTVYQTERLVNPKAVWRSHELQNEDDEKFNVILYKKDSDNPSKFEKIFSKGAWRAKIVATTNDDFLSLDAKGNREVGGSTNSLVDFTILFNNKNIGATNCECAIIEVRYHGTCVHNIFVRQGFHYPLKLAEGGTNWSSYNLYSCGTPDDNNYPLSGDAVDAKFTFNPIALGSFFRRCNYYQAINVQNVKNTAAGFGPLDIPGTNSRFELTDRAEADWKTWSQIQWNNKASKWVSTFNITQEINSEEETKIVTRPYRIAQVSDYEVLKNQEFGIGVIYCNGATAPSDETSIAYGFLDENNETISSKSGMRGIICYNPATAHQIFFPIGTMGIGRRNGQNIEGLPNPDGSLRYGALPSNYTIGNTSTNTLRPITYNISRASGAIYWAEDGNEGCWDMNYSDLNFNRYDGTFGDALPIRLVIDDDKLNASN